jgi:hypothetical protein
MTEDYLHYIWKFKLINTHQLKTATGESVELLNFGTHNLNSGPDFFNAKVKIGDTTWAGNIEIHINSSDWAKHKHQFDKAYNNVVLHVVYQHDKEVFTQKEFQLPVIELNDRINHASFEQYKRIVNSTNWVPCKKQFHAVNEVVLSSWMDRLLVERLERKSMKIVDSLKANKNNWQESFYHALAQNFGFKVNAEPFELLAKSLPLSCISKQKDDLFQIEAMLFGQAGLLNETFKDDYPKQLQAEYKFFKQKYKLRSNDGVAWKFSRLRPNNFPTLRIAEFAKLLYLSSSLFSYVLEETRLENLFKLFNVQTEGYWNNHFVFDKNSEPRPKRLGKLATENIIINTIVPFLFVYGKQKNNEVYCKRALQFLEEVKFEKNTITKNWKEMGVKLSNAYDSQALIELKNEYCSRKKCLNCSVGINLLK